MASTDPRRPTADASAVAGWRTWPLLAAGFVTAFGAHAIAANLGRYATNRHASLLELGVLLALYDGAEVLLKPAFGALADRIGARPLLIGGLLGFAVASAAFVLAGEQDALAAARFAQGAAAAGFAIAVALPGLPGLLLAGVAVGIGTGLVTPLGFAALSTTTPTSRLGQTMGAAEVGRELGDAGGPLLVGTIAGVAGLGLGIGLLGLGGTLLLTAMATSWRRQAT